MDIEYFHFPEISSTNDYAKELIDKKTFICVTADHQTAGRGRNNHSWKGSYGDNLYLSIGINHKHIPAYQNIALYQALSSLSTLYALNKVAGTKANFKMKYPNDIMVYYENDWRKISGCLCEHSFLGAKCTTTVIGIGVNINQTKFDPDISHLSVSLADLGIQTTPILFQEVLLEKFELLFRKDEITIMNLWKNELDMVGKECVFLGEEKKWIIDCFLPDLRLKLISYDGKEEVIIGSGDSIRYSLS